MKIPFPDLKIPRGWPKHPFRVMPALMLAALAGIYGHIGVLPYTILFMAAAMKLLWEL